MIVVEGVLPRFTGVSVNDPDDEAWVNGRLGVGVLAGETGLPVDGICASRGLAGLRK